jgi:hypothetical protein
MMSRQPKLDFDFNWRQKGVAAGRGWWRFANPWPCAHCGLGAEFEKGGNGKAGSGVRYCGYCRRQGVAEG